MGQNFIPSLRHSLIVDFSILSWDSWFSMAQKTRATKSTYKMPLNLQAVYGKFTGNYEYYCLFHIPLVIITVTYLTKVDVEYDLIHAYLAGALR